MIAIIRMRMVMYTAGTEIDKMGADDQNDSGYQQPGMKLSEEFFQNETAQAGKK